MRLHPLVVATITAAVVDRDHVVLVVVGTPRVGTAVAHDPVVTVN